MAVSGKYLQQPTDQATQGQILLFWNSLKYSISKWRKQLVLSLEYKPKNLVDKVLMLDLPRVSILPLLLTPHLEWDIR